MGPAAADSRGNAVFTWDGFPPAWKRDLAEVAPQIDSDRAADITVGVS
jgi:hypothetical protein